MDNGSHHSHNDRQRTPYSVVKIPLTYKNEILMVHKILKQYLIKKRLGRELPFNELKITEHLHDETVVTIFVDSERR